MKVVSTEITDFEICESGGLVLAKVGNLRLSEVAGCVQNYVKTLIKKCIKQKHIIHTYDIIGTLKAAAMKASCSQVSCGPM